MLIEWIPTAAINLILDVVLLLLLDILGDESLVVPLAVKEVGESPGADVDKLMENCWNDSLGVDLKVKACLLGQPQELLQHEAGGLLEDWVDARVDESRVGLAILLSNQDLVLYMEVRDVVLEVDIF